MKLVFLPLFGLILLVYADNEVVVDPSTDVDQLTADTLYETLFSDFYKPQKSQTSSKKSSKNKNGSNSKNQGLQVRGGSNGYENKNKQSNQNEKDIKFVSDEYFHYLQPVEGYKAEYESRLIGRKGLGYDKRTATTYGFRAPITAELLEEVGQKYQKRSYEEKIIPLLI
ncbi:uncharacterized protein LOC124533291 [Vanessa cardui]|uniref:uncharacterized protein LOC124533291 n=1 Tax=Vanessa cardui TaxID=171605 RepID=UPI001F13D29F|nr:uncharacterized protein LOC124533291 [Vanessa cardui]